MLNQKLYNTVQKIISTSNIIKEDLPYTVVIDIDHINGLQTARIFHDRKVKVIGIANDLTHYCAQTNVCEKIIKSNTKTEDLIATLLSIADQFESRPVLIPSQDTSVLLVSRNRNKLEKYYRIALPEEDVVEMLMDKPKFYEYASRENLPVAKYFLIKDRNEAGEASKNLNYPCIIKPPIKSELWESNTKIKAYKVYNAGEFLNVYDMCSQWTEILLAQEWIEGTDVDLYSCNCYYNEQSEPLVSFVSKKLRQYPPVTGNTSLGVECKADEVLNTTLELFKKVNYQGLGYVEMKRDIRDGKYIIIEPNIGRPTGRSALAEASGVELLYTMYSDLAGLPLPPESKQKHTGVKWIHFRADFTSAYYYWKQNQLSIKDYIKSISGKKFYAVFSIKDPKPFIAEVFTGLKVLFGMKK